MKPAVCDNPTTGTNPAGSSAHPAEKAVPAPYIYILSSGGSGSTLLELLLGGHPDIEPMGEVAMLPLQLHRKGPYRCSCGESPTECSVWKRIIGDVEATFGIDFVERPFSFRVSDLGLEEDHGVRAPWHWILHAYYRTWRYLAYKPVPGFRHLGFLSLFHKTWARNRLFVADRFREYTDARAVVDSSKDYIGLRDLVECADRPIKAIFLTRDVRGVVWTSIRREQEQGHPIHVDVAIARWLKSNGRSQAVLPGLDRGDWLHLRYEDLCADLEGTLRRICAFLGHRFVSDMLELVPREHHTIGGSRLRYRGLGTIQESMAWKEHLSDELLQRISQKAGPLAREFGYEI